jgi:hypothetical protein
VSPVLRSTVWYAWVLLLFSASAMTDTGSKSFKYALVSTLETYNDVSTLETYKSWNRKEFTGCTGPHLFPRSTSEGLRTSSAESLSFHAFWTEMQSQLFHISTAADSGTLLSAAVQMVRALPRGGAAMLTRSTPGCGTLDGPSLAWAGGLSVAKTEKI